MAIQKTLRTALVTLGLFSASIAGYAHQQPENINKLLNSPVAQEGFQATDLVKLAESFLNNSSDENNLVQVAAQFKMAPDMMAISMAKTVSVLKLHLKPAEQETALQSIMASGFNQKTKARELSKELPTNNVVTEVLAQVFELEELLSSPANWEAISLEMWKAPKFNVQKTLAEPGVRTLQSILEKKRGIPNTSVSILYSNAEYAVEATIAAKNVALGLMNLKITDGLIVGEYEGVPVLVMHDSASVNNTAGIFRVNAVDNRAATEFIAISLKLLNELKEKPDALTFIMAHELGHRAHKHLMENTDTNAHEVPADSSAIEHMSAHGMTPKQIAKAYSEVEAALISVLPKSVLNAKSFVKMMNDRRENVTELLHTIETLKKPSTFASASYGVN